MVPAERSSSLVIRVLAVAKNRELNLCYPSLSPQGTKSLNHWSFEIGLCSGKGGGTAVSAVWRLVCFLATLPIGNKGADRSTRSVPPARRVYESERRAMLLS